MNLPRLLLLSLAVCATSGLLPAQETDTTAATDSTAGPRFSWVTRLVPLVQDNPLPYHLLLPWDQWGHSDLAASAANPFVPADIRLGGVWLDGSLGQPVLSAVISGAVIAGTGPDTALSVGTTSPASLPLHDLPAFTIAPLQDPSRANQTFLFWDQGDYLYQDVQVGGTVQMDESRNIMIAGQSLSHPGWHTMAGPSWDDYDGNVLQNYLLDYRRQIWPDLSFNYTLLYQQELVGLPIVEQDAVTADRRQSRTLAQGFTLGKTWADLTIHLHGASLLSDLETTTDDVSGKHIDRRSLSVWGGTRAVYRLTTRWKLEGGWEHKQRGIADRALGTQLLRRDNYRAGLGRESERWSAYGGLALVNSQFAPEGRLVLGSERHSLALQSAATSFFDLPHYGRRATLDFTSWLPGPIFLRRTTLALQTRGDRWHTSARLAYLEIDDGRTATTGGLTLDWTPWEEVLRFHGAGTAVSSPDSQLFPTRVYATAGFTFTLPLRRARARPFISGNATYSSNEFARWLDPRFADITPLQISVKGTQSEALWLNGEAGLKVHNFELRFRIHNAFGALIQNSPHYLPQPPWPDRPLKHYSISWRFLPQVKKAADR